MPDESLPLVLHTRVVTGFGGGPDKTILNSPRYLRERGYRSVCAYMHPPEDVGFEAVIKRGERAGALVLSVPDRGALDWGVVRQLRDYCRAQGVAIWHGHDYKSNALGLWLRRSCPMKLVSTVHGWGVQDTRRTRLYYAIDRFCLKRYDQVICVSEDLYRKCESFGVKPHRLSLVANAIDLDEFRRLPDHARTPECITVGALGRLSAEKGFHHLIRAVAELVRAGVQCRLVIGGEGAERRHLEQLIEDLGCEESVQLLGQVHDVVGFFSGLDFFVLSSIREGLPNVVLEAMAMQVPVVATRIAGVPHLIEHQVHGWLVEPDSMEALKAGIAALLGSRDLQRDLVANARERIESHYSFAARMDKIAAIYDKF
ncbi:MAG: glycosyltransferase family 4 protein [Planctomycetales bacterium]|nr:glycosyltransferase family 4 protein [Planctomycetales bacterium]